MEPGFVHRRVDEAKGLDSHSLRSRSPVMDNTKRVRYEYSYCLSCLSSSLSRAGLTPAVAETWHNGGSSPRLTMGFKPRNERPREPRTHMRKAKLQYKPKTSFTGSPVFSQPSQRWAAPRPVREPRPGIPSRAPFPRSQTHAKL